MASTTRASQVRPPSTENSTNGVPAPKAALITM